MSKETFFLYYHLIKFAKIIIFARSFYVTSADMEWQGYY